MHSTDTIVALSTPPGRSGIGVIRLSGKGALDITRSLVRDEDFNPEPNHVTLKKIRDPENDEAIDQSLITYFKAPHSFTGEDVIELSCHGSPVLLRQIVDLILRLDARAADPGEFTLRALANGRMNLSQAEAVRDLINAQTHAAARQAVRQLGGELSSRLQPIKDSLLEIIVRLESSLEFVEDDLPSIETSHISSKISNIADYVMNLAATFRAGRLLREGIKVTLVGRPNVGKSSVFNGLLSSDRAIVTDIPGTTRDSLSELISLEGVPVLLTDTAGIRSSDDKVESLGVERTRRAMADADLVIVVLDSSEPFNAEDNEALDSVADNLHLIAHNKSDLLFFENNNISEIAHGARAIINVSAKTGAGLDALREAILEPFAISDIYDPGVLITNARHFDLLQRTHNELITSNEVLDEGRSEELILVGLHNALRFLGEITGETTTEDILSQIFSTFCIGK
ncbi:MAG: tRNA uridine-5-carboxymethylaminomethyl(34) synthesis GTPase MnmE [Acidobacteria bacterium 13_1_20CM_3_53_8]|nr:MAG: tRNA uridine-5-carboxymethylaminomethyl(34) synthesis GTPase MnmE [Acidobacteria bacterium 13_1_20CM_3_53_8]